MVRASSQYGSPFSNTNSGIAVNDSVNEKRLQQGFQNWWNSTAEDKDYRAQFKNSICIDKVQYSKYLGPVFGLALGKFFTDAYCSPKYFYLRYFIMGFGLFAGFKYARNVEENYTYSFYTKNYHLFPKEIQDAIRSRDARYVRQYWQN